MPKVHRGVHLRSEYTVRVHLVLPYYHLSVIDVIFPAIRRSYAARRLIKVDIQAIAPVLQLELPVPMLLGQHNSLVFTPLCFL